MKIFLALALSLIITAALSAGPASAGTLRERIIEMRVARAAGDALGLRGDSDDEFGDTGCARKQKFIAKHQERLMSSDRSRPTPSFANIAYGPSTDQKLDVYAPSNARNAPIIIMVHGGAWCIGDKQMDKVTINKVARWLPRGFIFVSINYRMLPTSLDVQAQDVASAVAYVQSHASTWGGDGHRIILMGHSAGAHLVSLVGSEPQYFANTGLQPWLGTVSLDSATINVPATMNSRHFKLHDDAFGTNPQYWKSLSPFDQMSTRSLPWLGVCSRHRSDSCPQAHEFSNALGQLRILGGVSEQDLSHGEINDTLGLPSAYTDTVEDFMRKLDPVVAQHLQ